MANLLEKTGKIVFLRAHDLGTGFGPPNDALDVEAVFILNTITDGAMGFQLRNDGNLPATMRPVDLTVTGLGIVLGTYEPAGPVRHGSM